jgi:VWFA-related protein
LKSKAWAAALLLPAVVLAANEAREARKIFAKAVNAAKARRTEEARRGFERAVALDPGFADAWHALGKAYAESGRYPDARRCFETAIQADPGVADPLLSLAMLQHSNGEWDHLIATTERVIQIDRYNWPLAWLFHGAAHYNVRRLDEAEKSAREAVRLDPGRRFSRSVHLLGEILLARGDWAGAARQFRDFLKLAPRDPDAESIRTRLARLDGWMENAPPEPATFRVTTELTLVRFQVTPDRKQFLTDLRPDDIELRENGVPQTIALFEGGRLYPRTVPIEVTLLFDCSGSVRLSGRLDPYVFQTSLLDEFENVSVAIYGFSDALIRLTTPTRDRRRLKEALNGVLAVPSGGTPLFQSIGEAARQAASTGANAVRLLVVISDGLADVFGDAGRVQHATQAAVANGIAIYPVVLSVAGLEHFPGRHSVPEFVKLAAATGGQSFGETVSEDLLARVLRGIAQQLRYDYVAGYYRSSPGDDRKHDVEVRWRSAPRGQIVGGRRVTAR